MTSTVTEQVIEENERLTERVIELTRELSQQKMVNLACRLQLAEYMMLQVDGLKEVKKSMLEHIRSEDACYDNRDTLLSHLLAMTEGYDDLIQTSCIVNGNPDHIEVKRTEEAQDALEVVINLTKPVILEGAVFRSIGSAVIKDIEDTDRIHYENILLPRIKKIVSKRDA